MAAQGRQRPKGRTERQRASLLQQGEPRQAGFKTARAQAKDEEGRREARLFLLADGRDEEKEHLFQDRERAEQPYKQEP